MKRRPPLRLKAAGMVATSINNFNKTVVAVDTHNIYSFL